MLPWVRGAERAGHGVRVATGPDLIGPLAALRLDVQTVVRGGVVCARCRVGGPEMPEEHKMMGADDPLPAFPCRAWAHSRTTRNRYPLPSQLPIRWRPCEDQSSAPDAKCRCVGQRPLSRLVARLRNCAAFRGNVSLLKRRARCRCGVSRTRPRAGRATRSGCRPGCSGRSRTAWARARRQGRCRGSDRLCRHSSRRRNMSCR